MFCNDILFKLFAKLNTKTKEKWNWELNERNWFFFQITLYLAMQVIAILFCLIGACLAMISNEKIPSAIEDSIQQTARVWICIDNNLSGLLSSRMTIFSYDKIMSLIIFSISWSVALGFWTGRQKVRVLFRGRYFFVWCVTLNCIYCVGFQYRYQVLNPFQLILIVCLYCCFSHLCSK